VEKHVAWDIPAIQCYEPDDGVYYAQMGPTGGKHGYSAITGERRYFSINLSFAVQKEYNETSALTGRVTELHK